jgi:hypothetical protein
MLEGDHERQMRAGLSSSLQLRRTEFPWVPRLPLPVTSLLVLAAGLLLAFGTGCGSGGGATQPAARPQPKRPSKPIARLAANRLPSPISGEAALAQPGGVLVIGGLNSSDVSSSGVFELSAATGKAKPAGSLSEPLHDTAAAELGGEDLVFGGGSLTEIATVEALRRGGTGQVIGNLPSARSDLSAVAIGDRAYVFGGYDGQAPLGAVLQTTDGRHFTTVSTLPVPFRYAAVATVGQTIYTFGGELASGLDSRAIQAIDTRTGRSRIVGQLPRALSHASAVALRGRVYVLGGLVPKGPTAQILTFDPSTAKLRLAGRLPFPVTNAAAAVLGGTGYLIGGLDARGASLASVIEVRLTT